MSFLPPKLNGRAFDSTSLRCSGLPLNFDSTLFTQYLVNISFSEVITVSESQGTHGIPLPRGRGKYKANASIEVNLEAWDAFTKNLAANGVDGYSDFDFDMLIQYKTQGRVCEVVLKEASLLGPDASDGAANNGGLTRKVMMYVRYILTNGVCPYPLDLDQDLTDQSNGGVVIGV